MYSLDLQTKVKNLRAKGKTYSEILDQLKTKIPKSTIAEWCREIELPSTYYIRIKKLNKLNTEKAILAAANWRKEKRDKFLSQVEHENKALIKFFKKDIMYKKITLTTLYLAEGSKTNRGSMMFGNSDPIIILMFVNLLRECYKIDESKFRCTVQCRADQNTSELEKFWSEITNIQLKQFYKARIDKRTIGKVSRKLDYKGVCRLDYFSSSIDQELKHIALMMKQVFITTKGL